MFVERAAEREHIDTLLALTRVGSGSALVVRGGPGIGRSALLGYAGDHADGLRERLDEIPERHAEEAAVEGRAEPEGAEQRSLPATAAEEQPLLCLIDDAHWLDAASSDAVVFLARRLEADSVARDATNKESAAQLFLSPKTIEKHLGSSDSKLGLRSRPELARIFAANEPAAADVAARA